MGIDLTKREDKKMHINEFGQVQMALDYFGEIPEDYRVSLYSFQYQIVTKEDFMKEYKRYLNAMKEVSKTDAMMFPIVFDALRDRVVVTLGFDIRLYLQWDGCQGFPEFGIEGGGDLTAEERHILNGIMTGEIFLSPQSYPYLVAVYATPTLKGLGYPVPDSQIVSEEFVEGYGSFLRGKHFDIILTPGALYTSPSVFRGTPEYFRHIPKNIRKEWIWEEDN